MVGDSSLDQIVDNQMLIGLLGVSRCFWLAEKIFVDTRLHPEPCGPPLTFLQSISFPDNIRSIVYKAATSGFESV